MEIDQAAEGKPSATYRLELYKSLRHEATRYVEKVPALWIQKFLLVGAVIAFLFANSDRLEDLSAGRELLVAAVATIPILSLLLDAKILSTSCMPERSHGS